MSEVEKNYLLEKIRLTLQAAAKKVWLEHKKNNQPIVVSDKDGTVRLIAPADIKV